MQATSLQIREKFRKDISPTLSDLRSGLERTQHVLNRFLSPLGNADFSVNSSNGLLRKVDEHILAAVYHSIYIGIRPMRILSLGAGVTWNSDERFGRPFLEERLKMIFGDNVEVVCSDIRGGIDDFVLFGSSPHNNKVHCISRFKVHEPGEAALHAQELRVIDKATLLKVGQIASSTNGLTESLLDSNGRFSIRPALDSYAERECFGVVATPGVDFFSDITTLSSHFKHGLPHLIFIRHGWPRLNNEKDKLMKSLLPLTVDGATVIIGAHDSIYRFSACNGYYSPVNAEKVFQNQYPYPSEVLTF